MLHENDIYNDKMEKLYEIIYNANLWWKYV